MNNMERKKAKLGNLNQIETYLCFELNNELFGVNVKNVFNILEMKEITKVPQSPDYFSGLINLRGNSLPVVDLRIIFGISDLKFSNKTCILVLQVKIGNDEVTLGAIVDSVKEVLEINEDLIDSTPGIGSNYRSEFINGVWKINERFIMLLDLNKVFTSKETLFINEAI